MAKTKKKNSLLVVLFILLIAISVGYAAFAQTLYINGTANANGNFKLKFTDYKIDPNIGAEESTASISASGDTLSVDMQLKYPGAGGVVTATITNTGTIPAKLNGVNFTGTGDSDIIVTYDKAVVGEVIEPNGTTEVVITVKWAENSTNAKSINFTATLDYVQSTTNFDDATSTTTP